MAAHLLLTQAASDRNRVALHIQTLVPTLEGLVNMMDSSEKGLAVAALLIDVLSAYVLAKRVVARFKDLRPARPLRSSRRNLHLVS